MCRNQSNNSEFSATRQSDLEEKRKKIDITLPKYDGSTDTGNFPVLCIKNVQKKNDEGTYTIVVHNKLGEGKHNDKLVIIEGMIHA